MPVEIQEMSVQLNVTDGAGPMDAASLEQIVKAVMKELAKQQAAQKSQNADLDTRSIVQQQRGGRR
jgi:hypothetical protein